MFKDVFVFGSNLGGFHGAGSAAHACENLGFPLYLGVGYHGKCYAIPTKDSNIEALHLDVIKLYVDQFLEFAADHEDWRFNIVAIGCGLAGFKVRQIAPMFKNRTPNCILPKEFLDFLEEQKHNETTKSLELLGYSYVTP